MKDRTDQNELWGLVDPQRYRALNARVVPATGVVAEEHFALHGWRLGCLPNAWLAPTAMARLCAEDAPAPDEATALKAWVDAGRHQVPRLLIVLEDAEDRPVVRATLAALAALDPRGPIEPFVLARQGGALLSLFRQLAHAGALLSRFATQPQASGAMELAEYLSLLQSCPPALVLAEVPDGPLAQALAETGMSCQPLPDTRHKVDPLPLQDAPATLCLAGGGPLSLNAGIERFGLVIKAALQAHDLPLRCVWAGDGAVWPNTPPFYARHLVRLAGRGITLEVLSELQAQGLASVADIWFSAEHDPTCGWVMCLEVAGHSPLAQMAQARWGGPRFQAGQVQVIAAELSALAPAIQRVPGLPEPDPLWWDQPVIRGAFSLGELADA